MLRISRIAFAIAFPGAVAMMAGTAEARSPQTPGQSPPPVAVGPATSAVPGQDVQAIREELDRLREEFAAIRRQYDERLVALEERLGQLVGGPRVLEVPTPAAPAQQDPAVAASQASSAGAASSKIFNPDLSVIGNFVGVGGKNPNSDQPALQLSEAEMALQAVVDPYARADFYLSAGPGGLDIEEGFVTFTSLPANMLLKVGKMRAQFGKVNTLHTHALPTIDRPLVTENLVGGEEGLSDSGLSVSHLVQNPLLFLDVIGEVYSGTSEVFQTSRRSRLNYVGRLRAYRDITESTNLDIGTSVAFGPTEGHVSADLLTAAPVASTLDKRLIGVDATFRYRPLRRAIYQRLNLRTELVWSRQDLADALATSAFGVYGLGEYQFARRWYAGARLDRSGRVYDGSLKDSGGAVFVTFWPTEFSQIRTQYRRRNYAEGDRANEFMFQFNFAIGAHGAHAF